MPIAVGTATPAAGANNWHQSHWCMFYGGSVSPPRQPPRKKLVVPRKSPSREMGGEGSSSSGSAHGVRESSLMWPMLTRSNYTEWAMLMQCNYETLEIWDTIEPGGEGVKRP